MSGLAIETLVRAMQAGGKEGVAAAIFWTKMRKGWSEKLVVDDDRSKQPMRVVVEVVSDPAPVTAETAERQTLRPGFDAGRLAA